MDDPQTSENAPGEAAEPTHSAAAQEEIHKRLFANVLEHPEQLRPGHAADHAGDGGIERTVGQPRSWQLAPEQPQTDERPHSDEHTETGDLELADAEQDWIHLDLWTT